MKKYLFFSFVAMFLFLDITDAQIWRRERREYVFSFGATNFLGDLGGSPQIGSEPFSLRDFNWPATRWVVSAGYRYRLTRSSSIKGSAYFGYLYGNDKFSDNPARNNRNIHFKSPLLELSAQYEYMTSRQREGRRYALRGVRGWRYINIESYIFAGLGFFAFYPQSYHPQHDKWYNLRPLSTEGQGFVRTRRKYSIIQPVIPVGIGIKYAISKNWSIGLEYGIRKTFTDYIDDTSTSYFDNDFIRENKGDVAAYFADPSITREIGQTDAGMQRGDPTDKDSYMFALFNVYYKIARRIYTVPKF